MNRKKNDHPKIILTRTKLIAAVGVLATLTILRQKSDIRGLTKMLEEARTATTTIIVSKSG